MPRLTKKRSTRKQKVRVYYVQFGDSAHAPMQTQSYETWAGARQAVRDSLAELWPAVAVVVPQR